MKEKFVNDLIAIGSEIAPRLTNLCPKLEFPTNSAEFRANLQDYPGRLSFRNFLRNGL